MGYMKWVLKVALLLLFVFVFSPPSLAQEKPAVIPYQGQLADQEGKPVNPAEAITLVFRIYSQPTGGTPTWHEAHENVSVVGGRFSVLLGAREPFPDLTMFNQTVYLGVTVDDGQPATADVEMRPRQAIVPAIAAVHAAEAEVAERAINADNEIPIGGITMFFGLERDLPGNWKICNGQLVDDPNSPFDKRRLPDLRGLFVRGAKDDLVVGSSEGVDRIPLHRTSAQTAGGQSEVWGAADASLGDNRPRHMALHYIIRIR